ncbi:hypothetical protein CUMW_154730 [Citrus unshiu]|nr:hypothetical protein CUMW_154730 [Citrus unshiu]
MVPLFVLNSLVKQAILIQSDQNKRITDASRHGEHDLLHQRPELAAVDIPITILIEPLEDVVIKTIDLFYRLSLVFHVEEPVKPLAQRATRKPSVLNEIKLFEAFVDAVLELGFIIDKFRHRRAIKNSDTHPFFLPILL